MASQKSLDSERKAIILEEEKIAKRKSDLAQREHKERAALLAKLPLKQSSFDEVESLVNAIKKIGIAEALKRLA
jgi:hypothetical protein